MRPSIRVAVGLLLALPPLFWGLRGEWRAFRSRDWPAVQGRVTESSVFVGTLRSKNPAAKRATSTEAALYVPQVFYAFEVDGRTHTGSRVSFTDERTTDYAAAQTLVARYPARSTVNVYHDPDDPELSVLERRGGGPNRIAICAGLGLGAGWLYVTRRRPRRRFQIVKGAVHSTTRGTSTM